MGMWVPSMHPITFGNPEIESYINNLNTINPYSKMSPIYSTTITEIHLKLNS